MSVSQRFDPATSALLVVDVLNDFCDPAGVYARNGVDVSAATAMVPRLEKLIESARQQGVRVVFVGTTHSEQSDTDAWLRRRDGRPREALPLGVPCQAGTWGAEFYRVAPDPDEMVIVKHRYSAFVGTNLAESLRELGVTSVVCTGVVTEACVESTARDALFHDFHVTVVEDCCAGYRPAAHAASMETLSEYFGVVQPSDDVVRAWQAHRQ